MENMAKVNISNLRFDMAMEPSDGINELGPTKDLSINDYKQRLDNYPNSKLSILNKNKYSNHQSFKYDDAETYTYDKIDRYKGIMLDERSTRNPQHSLKFNNDGFEYEPKTKMLDPIEPGIRPLPLKTKKTQKFRKRSKLGKEDTQSILPLKSRINKVGIASATSTPVNGQESANILVDQSIASNGKFYHTFSPVFFIKLDNFTYFFSVHKI